MCILYMYVCMYALMMKAKLFVYVYVCAHVSNYDSSSAAIGVPVQSRYCAPGPCLPKCACRGVQKFEDQ